MAYVAHIDYEMKHCLLYFGEERKYLTLPFNEIAIMMESPIGFYPIEAKENEEMDVEWGYEGDILLLEYEDEVTGEKRSAFGVLDFDHGEFLLDFPQYGRQYPIPNDQEGCYLVGNIWQPETWEKVKDESLILLMIGWLKEEGVEYNSEALEKAAPYSKYIGFGTLDLSDGPEDPTGE